MHRRDLLKFSVLLLGTAATSSVTRALTVAGPLTSGTTATVFDTPQQATIELLSDMIIPATDTPGAVAAGVPDFIATIVAEWYTPTERRIFFEGLRGLDDFSLGGTGKPFYEADETTRVEALRQQEELVKSYQAPQSGGRIGIPPIDENTPFFTKLKELVVLGYYTSEVGAKEELIYLPMPGYFDGDYDFAKVGRQWITN